MLRNFTSYFKLAYIKQQKQIKTEPCLIIKAGLVMVNLNHGE